MLARAARLSAPARRLLEAVAVVPGPVEPALLELVSEGSLEDLAECLSSGILSAGRAHVAFRHELARFAIEDAITPDRRLALHRAALAALAAAPDDELDVARLAHHAEAAQDEAGVLRWAYCSAPIARPPSSTRARCGSPPVARPRARPSWPTCAPTSAT